MALSSGLTQSDHAPEQLAVSATVTLDLIDGTPTVTTSRLSVSGRVAGIDQAAFEAAASDAGKNCPVSRALGGVEITVDARLDN
jgi:osmotically inducible protein OsmC